MQLTSKYKQQLKAQAHALKPVVIIGQHGLTEAVQNEIEQTLHDHELIKIRIPAIERGQRQILINEICTARNAQLVQSIGRIIVLYRKNKDKR